MVKNGEWFLWWIKPPHCKISPFHHRMPPPPFHSPLPPDPSSAPSLLLLKPLVALLHSSLPGLYSPFLSKSPSSTLYTLPPFPPLHTSVNPPLLRIPSTQQLFLLTTPLLIFPFPPFTLISTHPLHSLPLPSQSDFLYRSHTFPVHSASILITHPWLSL